MRALANLWHGGATAHRGALLDAGLHDELAEIQSKHAPGSRPFELAAGLLEATGAPA